jgi:hypothetical protein
MGERRHGQKGGHGRSLRVGATASGRGHGWKARRARLLPLRRRRRERVRPWPEGRVDMAATSA